MSLRAKESWAGNNGMEQLTAPSKDLISSVLQEVDFKDRLSGSLVHQRAGVKILSLYSVQEVFALLNNPYPHIDLQQLEQWVRMVIKDGELSDRIKTISAQNVSDRDKLFSIRDLMGFRLVQCTELHETAVPLEPDVG